MRNNIDLGSEYTAKLIDKALSGEHSEFEFLRSAAGYSAAKGLKKALKSLCKGFEIAAISSYEAAVCEDGDAERDAEALMALAKAFAKCVAFYREEIALVSDAMAEFRAYRRSGNRIAMLLGFCRKESELVDYRTLPFSLF